MNILVTGGAGYVGSNLAHHLCDLGHSVVVVDNLYSGHRWAIPDKATFYEGCFGDQTLLRDVLDKHNIETVVHCGAFVEVGESMGNPLKYYKNNTLNALNLIESCLQVGVTQFLFSSTAALYGNPEKDLIDELSPIAPINPYGCSKFATEMILKDVSQAHLYNPKNKHFRYVSLRYFNVAGANMDGKVGQATPRATHLIKVACQTAVGLNQEMNIFGTDYPTTDGTCVRDYIHVDDLASAHLVAINYLSKGGESEIFNCGYGHGYSVREVIDTVKEVSGVDFKVNEAKRRPGDPATLVADSKKLQQLGWKPQYDDIRTICRSAYNWELKLKDF